MSAPLFVTALSVPFLSEKVGIHRWSAVCIGFVAVMVMLRPGTELFQPIMVLPLIAAIGYAFIPITTRLISGDISTFTITFHTTFIYWFFCAVGSIIVHLVPAASDSGVTYQAVAEPWNELNNRAALLIIFCALLMLVSIYLLTFAYQRAQASFLTSFEYTYLVWAMLIAYVMFDETPSLLTYTECCYRPLPLRAPQPVLD